MTVLTAELTGDRRRAAFFDLFFAKCAVLCIAIRFTGHIFWGTGELMKHLFVFEKIRLLGAVSALAGLAALGSMTALHSLRIYLQLRPLLHQNRRRQIRLLWGMAAHPTMIPSPG